MPTRNIVLTKHQAELIDRLVDSGQYEDASEVLRDGLRLIERRETENEAKLRILREAAQTGIEDIEQGNYRTFRTSAGLQKYLRKLAGEAKRHREPRKPRR